MIDIENLMINKVFTALRSNFSRISCYGEYVETPPSFPCVCLVEDDNYIYEDTQTVDEHENHVRVTYTITVYTNSSDKKGDAKAVLKVADEIMLNNNFTRTFMSQIPNVDRTKYRVMARYQAIVEKPKVDGGNETYTVYRR